MKLLKKLIFIISCWIISSSAFSQFYGGNGDGFVHSETGITTVNTQELYCLGGNGEGTDKEYLSTTINTQNIYCGGGEKDGNDFSSSGVIVQVDQAIYCSGGDDDGYSFDAFSAPFSDQNFYCSGGNGDGFNYATTSFITQSEQVFYCSGGEGDGYHTETTGFIIQNDQSFYCQGGDQNGYFMQSSGIIAPNDASYYCSGGSNSGYHVDDVSGTINTQNFYCSGSTGDGYDLAAFNATINTQGLYCTGGNSDGFSYSDYNGYVYGGPLFCYGGYGDGFNTAISSSELLGVGIWTGITSTDWESGSNWMHNTVPGLNDNVTIPAACPNYPVVIKAIGVKYSSFFNIKCNRLEVNPGASLSHSSSLYVEGEMKVAGNYTNTLNTDYSQRIQNGGVLTVTPTGYVKMGNQTGGTGRTDLLINNGGTVNIVGGILEIDDQIRVNSGGTLNMSSGELFVHKFGDGSALTLTRSAKFYVESGALGEISGGTLRICGLESNDGNHSVYIGEPGFLFSGDATVSFQNGVNPTHYNTGIYTVAGVSLQNLTVNKPGNTVRIYSNLEVEQEVHIETNSSLKVEQGFQITVGQ